MRSNEDLYATAAALMADGKGILAADESDGTAGKRLAMVGLPNEPEYRQGFRELLFTAPGIEEFISGVIMYDSSMRNTTDDGIPFPDVLTARGMIPGIKVDRGLRPFQNFEDEQVTQGLDDLAERLKEYYALGARFTKWRAAYTISTVTPTPACMEANAVMLARYAALAQEAGLVPMVEPEVIFAGAHSIERAEEVTMHAVQTLFTKLREYRVDPKGVILKTSMVLAGDAHTEQSTPEQVANATVRMLHMSVPYDIAGIVFLSGGQAPKRATENLNAIGKLGKQVWPISSSFSRALEEPFLTEWQGKEENTAMAQKALLYRAKMNGLAQQGKYNPKRDVQAKKSSVKTGSQD